MKKIFMILCVVTGLIACQTNENTVRYQLDEAKKDAKTAQYFLDHIDDNPTYDDSVDFYVNTGMEHCEKAELLQAKELLKNILKTSVLTKYEINEIEEFLKK